MKIDIKIIPRGMKNKILEFGNKVKIDKTVFIPIFVNF